MVAGSGGGEQLSQEQLGQLYELMHATKDVWKPVEQLGQVAAAGNEDGSKS